jgi:hypothetical protein
MVTEIFIILMLWITVCFLHELGHLIIARTFDKNALIVFSLWPIELATNVNDTNYLYAPNGTKQMFFILGIILGYIPLFIYSYYYPFMGTAFILIYLIPIKSDIQQIRSLNEKKEVY